MTRALDYKSYINYNDNCEMLVNAGDMHVNLKCW